MANPTQSAIIWPEEFLPGTTDNFVTNEVIVKGMVVCLVLFFLFHGDYCTVLVMAFQLLIRIFRPYLDGFQYFDIYIFS